MGNIDIALYQPDIAGNTGTIMRFCACTGCRLHIIEPAGFDLSDRNLKRAGMDYLELASLTRHVDWAAFNAWRTGEKRRLILLTTRAGQSYTQFRYAPGDVILFGRESAGAPDAVHAAADHRLVVPMQPGARSLNLAMAVAMVSGEALRQVGPHA